MFLGGFKRGAIDNFYYVTTSLMIITTVISLAYSLRLFGKSFFGSPKIQKIKEMPASMAIPIIILSASIIILGIWPRPIIKLISTAI